MSLCKRLVHTPSEAFIEFYHRVAVIASDRCVINLHDIIIKMSAIPVAALIIVIGGRAEEVKGYRAVDNLSSVFLY